MPFSRSASRDGGGADERAAGRRVPETSDDPEAPIDPGPRGKAESASMAILLIRHGETALNAVRIVQFPDTPLSEHGIDQAARLARHLASFPVRAILSSDYARARMTAEAIHDVTGLAIEVRSGLRERNFGDFRGRPHDDLPPAFRFDGAAPPGGESIAAFDARVEAEWAEVTGIAIGVEGDTAVVTHGLVCRSVVERLVDNDYGPERAPAMWGNTALTVLEPGERWRVSLLASTRHLDALPRA